MHPIEHLRYLARTTGLDPATLVREVAYALSSAPFDPAMLVVVGRRLLERHADVAQLWWLLSGVMTSAEPQAAAWELGQRLEDDPTFQLLADGLPVGARVGIDRWSEAAAEIVAHRTDVEVVIPEALGITAAPDEPGAEMIGAEMFVVEARAASAATILVARADAAVVAARPTAADLWVVCPLGTRLPDQVVAEIATHSDSGVATIGIADVAAVVSAGGVTRATSGSIAGALAPDGPLAPELLHRPVG